jgi:hypothetical protein
MEPCITDSRIIRSRKMVDDFGTLMFVMMVGERKLDEE